MRHFKFDSTGSNATKVFLIIWTIAYLPALVQVVAYTADWEGHGQFNGT